MTLTLTLAQNSALRSLAVCALAALALALGCGGDDENETFYVPTLDKSESTTIIRVSGILASSEIPARLNDLGFGLPSDSLLENPDEWKSELRDGLESNGFMHSDSIATLSRVEGDVDYDYVVGDLDFKRLRNDLEDDGLEEDGYRGYELWESDFRATSILENRKIAVSGSGESVREFIKAFRDDEGFASATDPLWRAVRKTGIGLVTRAQTDCSLAFFSYSSSGCKAVSEKVTGGNADITYMFVAYLFSNERRAEYELKTLGAQGGNSLQGMINSLDGERTLMSRSDNGLQDVINSLNVELNRVKADGEFVTFWATIHE